MLAHTIAIEDNDDLVRCMAISTGKLIYQKLTRSSKTLRTQCLKRNIPFNYVIAIDQYIAPEDVIAVEVYNGTSQIPSQFQANLLNARCGVIAIWTRVGNERERASDSPKK